MGMRNGDPGSGIAPRIGGTKGGEERHYAEGSVATDIRVRGEV